MTQTDAEAGRWASFPSWASPLASASVALLLLMGSGAKANVPEAFQLSGDFNTILAPLGFGPLIPFTGSMNLDFNDTFTSYQIQSLQIRVQGSVFNLNTSVVLSGSTTGTIQASDSAHDMLTLLFTTPSPGAWTGFDTGPIYFGDLVPVGVAGGIVGARGVITRNLAEPAIIDPPAVTPSATAPELSTWTMMLIGLAGLGLVAKGRRALVLGRRA